MFFCLLSLSHFLPHYFYFFFSFEYVLFIVLSRCFQMCFFVVIIFIYFLRTSVQFRSIYITKDVYDLILQKKFPLIFQSLLGSIVSIVNGPSLFVFQLLTPSISLCSRIVLSNGESFVPFVSTHIITNGSIPSVIKHHLFASKINL